MSSKRGFQKVTSRRLASTASKIIRNPSKFSNLERRLAGSVLSQSRGKSHKNK